MSIYLNEMLRNDLDTIDFYYRVSTMMKSVLCAIGKEFSLPDNYPKVHGDEFKTWLLKYHPGALIVPVTRVTGSRQDLAVESAASVYWNQKYYAQFLDKCFYALDDDKKSIFQEENLFIILTSMEMIALCYDWSVRSMGKAIDTLHDAMVEIISDARDENKGTKDLVGTMAMEFADCLMQELSDPKNQCQII
eukprot:15360651-Ditylum_brightwellii.AAC.1